ncbi:MAG: hypothetical protein ACTHKV_03545 [Flavipsychrobacter sp.]
MKDTIIIAALLLIASTSCEAQQKDTTKPPPFVKSIPGDTVKYNTPVLKKMDTMKNNMPVVNPKEKNVRPK